MSWAFSDESERGNLMLLLLIAACAVLEPKAITNWVLDDEEPVQAMRDRRAIDRAIGDRTEFSYDHRPSHDEPLLWPLTQSSGAVGAGGPMFDRVRHLVEFVEVHP